MVAESHETAVPEVDLLRTSHKQELEWFRHVPLVSMILQYAASGASPPLIHVVSMVNAWSVVDAVLLLVAYSVPACVSREELAAADARDEHDASSHAPISHRLAARQAVAASLLMAALACQTLTCLYLSSTSPGPVGSEFRGWWRVGRYVVLLELLLSLAGAAATFLAHQLLFQVKFPDWSEAEDATVLAQTACFVLPLAVLLVLMSVAANGAEMRARKEARRLQKTREHQLQEAAQDVHRFAVLQQKHQTALQESLRLDAEQSYARSTPGSVTSKHPRAQQQHHSKTKRASLGETSETETSPSFMGSFGNRPRYPSEVTPATSKQNSQHVHVSSHVRAGSDAGSLLKDALLEVELQRHDDEDDRCGSTECSEPRAHMISSNSSP